MDSQEIAHRFTFHAPSPEKADRHAAVRGDVQGLAHSLNAQLPECREKDHMMMHLEEAMFWANAAIARHGEPAQH